ncbi:ABC transporter ATP-binding protein [Nakamurella endophytica]|uniref:ABC transporter ATP-binding protein n=1 Tax=Nakamurella endophytica TaxID=1748367 RepID=A0A917SWR6_9ACTN|nr:ABC transporter ATP-binding protein [Nakamurella endophytica]GGL99719.1 ABC transporter ATP-binding protein [Nakamurella endophytica]
MSAPLEKDGQEDGQKGGTVGAAVTASPTTASSTTASSTTASATAAPILAFDDVRVDYRGRSSTVSAVAGVSLELRAGETFGLVGESGCGKTTLSMAVMGLLPDRAQVSGEIRFRGEDLVTMPAGRRRRLRGDDVSMVFQDPATSLDATFPIGEQVAETIRAHRSVSRREARDRALQLLAEVGIPDPAARYSDPPHRLSGGMRQRVVIAAALANDPDLLLADEPTTALDVTIQAQILDLLAQLKQRHGMTMLLITHDLGVVAQICDRVGVMYAGQLVEVAPVDQLFAAPRHPYTRALLQALPSRAQRSGRLAVVEGQVPDLSEPPSGCRFKERCPHRMPVCDTTPAATPAGAGSVACWLETVDRATNVELAEQVGGAA